MQRAVLNAMHRYDAAVSLRLLPMLLYFSEFSSVFLLCQQHEMFIAVRWVHGFPVTRQGWSSDSRCGQLRKPTDHTTETSTAVKRVSFKQDCYI
jgi:hypothetical protein